MLCLGSFIIGIISLSLPHTALGKFTQMKKHLFLYNKGLSLQSSGLKSYLVQNARTSVLLDAALLSSCIKQFKNTFETRLEKGSGFKQHSLPFDCCQLKSHDWHVFIDLFVHNK